MDAREWSEFAKRFGEGLGGPVAPGKLRVHYENALFIGCRGTTLYHDGFCFETSTTRVDGDMTLFSVKCGQMRINLRMDDAIRREAGFEHFEAVFEDIRRAVKAERRNRQVHTAMMSTSDYLESYTRRFEQELKANLSPWLVEKMMIDYKM